MTLRGSGKQRAADEGSGWEQELTRWLAPFLAALGHKDRSRPAADVLTTARWRTVSWRMGTRGPLRARFAAVRVRVADGPVASKGHHPSRRSPPCVARSSSPCAPRSTCAASPAARELHIVRDRETCGEVVLGWHASPLLDGRRLLRRGVERGPYYRRKLASREWLGEEARSGRQRTALGRAIGIARHKQYR